MKCTHCNAAIPEGSSHCPNCQDTPKTFTTPQQNSLWKRSKVAMVLLCILGLWMISSIAGLFSTDPVEIELVDISPVKDVDEERFLLFVLEHQLDGILFYSHQKPEEAVPAIAETKEYAQAYVAHLQQHPVQIKGILESFQKVVGLADAYEGMLGDVGGIEKSTKDKKGEAALEVGIGGLATGWASAKALDSGNAKAAVAGVVAALWSAWQKGQTIEADKKAQLERVASAFFMELDQVRADAVVVADAVSQKHSWNRASVGFVRGQKAYGQEQLVRDSKDLAPVLEDLVRQRPLNPILQFKSIMLEDFLDGDGTSQQKHMEWSAKFIELARMVPSGAVYDFFRWRYMMRAGTMALEAAKQEEQGKKLGDSSKAAVTAASCWKTALSINVSDPSGELRCGYGHSLALAGKLDEAREVLSKIKEHVGSNPDYHYLLARLFSVNEEPDQSLEHLKEAIAKGFDKISEAREAQDLKNLRGAHGDEVSSILTVRLAWSVSYGMFNDDITIANQSAFPVTHLVLRPVISNSNGSFSPNQPLTLAKLDAGKSHTWANCVSVKGGGKEDRRKAELQCDQSPH
ncbi:tetratricopeptide repeat protein [Prosthecobacter sp.]|uniref:tetratricopeptide repeat protein n=1 Tax=Prosthecobacter sp. TaxID=1965333 RepID=UPI003783A919